MKILLIGEYSRLHNSLKEGLIQKGHTVTLAGSGDGFKNYPVDIPIRARFFSSPSRGITFFRKAFFKWFRIDLLHIENGIQFFLKKNKCTQFDVVQLINESALNTLPQWEKKAVLFLKKHNKKIFLLSCGDDFYSVTYMLNHKDQYHILTPYFTKEFPKTEFQYTLKYRSRPYKKLSKCIYDIVDAIIASDIDYHLPLQGNKKYRGLISNPVNIDTIPFHPLKITGKIQIFHGINTWNYIKKGNRYFEEALHHILKKYSNRVIIKTSRNVPYTEYLQRYKECHIMLDQVYSYDQGYNALEAMAMGKVVFTGAEKAFTAYYNLTEPVAINALPEVNALVAQLSFLIENPEQIIAIGKRARAFVEKHHHYIKIAEKYSNLWAGDIPAKPKDIVS